jgi:hypothetical protein
MRLTPSSCQPNVYLPLSVLILVAGSFHAPANSHADPTFFFRTTAFFVWPCNPAVRMLYIINTTTLKRVGCSLCSPWWSGLYINISRTWFLYIRSFVSYDRTESATEGDSLFVPGEGSATWQLPLWLMSGAVKCVVYAKQVCHLNNNCSWWQSSPCRFRGAVCFRLLREICSSFPPLLKYLIPLGCLFRLPTMSYSYLWCISATISQGASCFPVILYWSRFVQLNLWQAKQTQT